MGSLTVRPANVAYSFATGAWTQTGDAPALSDQDDGTVIQWAQASSSSGFFPPYVQGTMETTSVLQAAMAAGATNVHIAVHSRASGIGDESIDNFPPTLYPQLNGIVFDSHIIEPGNPGGTAYGSNGTDNVIHERSSLVTAGEPVSDGTASSLGDALAAGTASFHVEVDWSNDSTLTFAELWFVITWDDGEAWPLYWKTADGLELRIGPDFNPDGGICYFTTAAGVVYEQGMGSDTSLGGTDYDADSWTYHDNPDGVWDDDGATSLDVADDGLSVRFTRPAELDPEDANHLAHVDVFYAPPEPPEPGAHATSVTVWRDRPQPSSGTVNVELLDASGATVLASETGSLNHIFTTDPDEVAAVAANGCIQRLHAGDVAEVTEWDRVWMVVVWEAAGTVPVTFKSADGSEPVVLPMHQVYP